MYLPRMRQQLRVTVELDVLTGHRLSAEEILDILCGQRGDSHVRSKRVIDVVSSPPPGARAAFIYDSAGHGPCHAVVKDLDGPWSKNRYGFCGEQPQVGPVGSIDSPSGGLCRTCAEYVREEKKGLWVVVDEPPVPRPERPFAGRD